MITLDHIIFGLIVLILIGAILVRRGDKRFDDKLKIDFEAYKEGEDETRHINRQPNKR